LFGNSRNSEIFKNMQKYGIRNYSPLAFQQCTGLAIF
jgi:hypothetical protein